MRSLREQSTKCLPSSEFQLPEIYRSQIQRKEYTVNGHTENLDLWTLRNPVPFAPSRASPLSNQTYFSEFFEIVNLQRFVQYLVLTVSNNTKGWDSAVVRVGNGDTFERPGPLSWR